MKLAFRDIITYAIAALGRVLTPAFQRQLVRLCIQLGADVPQLGTTWVIHYSEPRRNGKSHIAGIDVELRQYGRFVRGRGHRQGEPGDPFVYRGTIKRNAFYGSFRRPNTHLLAGTGNFILKISPDSRRMFGHCTWYDSLLDDVWSSTYTWTRNG